MKRVTMRMLCVVALAIGCVIPLSATDVKITNNSPYRVEVTTYLPGAQDGPRAIKTMKTKTFSLSGCPKYMKFVFYHKGDPLTPDQLKLTDDFTVSEGDVWYNFGAGWAGFRCKRIDLTISGGVGSPIFIT